MYKRQGVVTLGIVDITGLASTIAGLATTSSLSAKQPSSAILSSLAGLSWAANMLPYGTSGSSVGLTAFTTFAQPLLACISAGAVITLIGAATPASVSAQIAGAAIESDQLVASFDDQVGTVYTFAPSDNGEVVTMTNAAAVAASLPDTLPKGWNVLVYQGGAGIVSFSALGTGTLRNRQGQYRTAGQYAVVSLLCVSNTTGTGAVFVLGGDTQT